MIYIFTYIHTKSHILIRICVSLKKKQVLGKKTHMQCVVIKAYAFQGETTTSSMTGYIQ